MNAISNLIEETAELNKYGLYSLQDTIDKIADIESTIEALLDAALEIQEILFDLFVLRVDFLLPPEAEKAEADAKRDGIFPSHQITNYTINIGFLNFSPLEEMLGDTFSEFETQTAGIAEIYAPALSEEQMKPSGKEVALQDIYSPLIKNKLYKELAGSAPIVNELTNICDRMADISIIRGDTNEYITSALSDTFPIVSLEEKEAARSEIPYNLNDFSDMVGNIASSINTKILEVQKVTEFMSKKKFPAKDDESYPMPHAGNTVEYHDSIIHSSEVMENFSADVHSKIAPSLNSLSVKSTQFTGLIESQQHSASAHKMFAMSDHIRELSDKSQDISTSIRTEISEVQKITESMLQKKFPAKDDLSNIIPPERTTIDSPDSIIHTSEIIGNLSDAVHTKFAPSLNSLSMNAANMQTIKNPDQKIIEIPAFSPRQKFIIPTQEASINAKNLSYAIESNHGKGSFSENYPSTQILTAQSAPAISNMFEAISNYITIASRIYNQMSRITEESMTGENNPILDMLTQGNSVVSILDTGKSGENSGFANGEVSMNIALGMATTDSLNRAGSMAIRSISAAIPPSGGNYQRSPDVSVPHSIENIMQFLSGAQKENTGVSQMSSGSVNFHNSFNITINVKGTGEETEIKDLGRKIGQILSDEIKRYGGKRWI